MGRRQLKGTPLCKLDLVVVSEVFELFLSGEHEVTSVKKAYLSFLFHPLIEEYGTC